MNTCSRTLAGLALLWSLSLTGQAPPEETVVEAEEMGIEAVMDEERVQLTLTAILADRKDGKPPLLHTTRVDREIRLEGSRIVDRRHLRFRRIQGDLDTITLDLPPGERPASVIGENLAGWSVRHTEGGTQLVLQFLEMETVPESVDLVVENRRGIGALPHSFTLAALGMEYPVLSSGTVEVTVPEGHAIEVDEESGLWALSEEPDRRRWRFIGTGYEARVKLAATDPDALRLVMEEMEIRGKRVASSLAFEVSGKVGTRNPRGAEGLLLGGEAALTGMDLPPGASVSRGNQGYRLRLAEPGSHPLSFRFVVRIGENEGWQEADFHLPPAALLPVHLEGFAPDTRFRESSSAVREKEGRFLTWLPASGRARLSWQDGKDESSSRLFYNTESRVLVRMGTGVMRQESSTTLSIMQGELETLEMAVLGRGEITRVSARDLLSWETGPGADEETRSLVLRFNQLQTGTNTVLVSTLTTLDSFPLEAVPVRIVPQGSVRHHGELQVVNEGAVRLDITATTGLSRISPGGVAGPPEHHGNHTYPSQRFAFRHSSTDYGLTVRVDDIEPEITASLLVMHHLGHDQIHIDADLELEIREAPIRDLALGIPADHVVAEVSSHHLADYFVGPDRNQLRLEFSRPVAGHHRIRLRLERNGPLEGTQWEPGPILLESARQLRGHIGISSVQGFRITPTTFTGVSEIPTVYFPMQVDGLQTAFRITDNQWSIQLDTTPIPREIRSDCTHLYSIGNGLISGSSLMQLNITGAPVDTFGFAIPEEYQNVEFTGEGVRNWERIPEGYQVLLQAPAMGLVTILISHDRPLSDAGDILDATGVALLDASFEQGTVILTSHRPIELEVDSEEGPVLQLAPEELSSEHRLLLNQPVLAAFRYDQRPFSLALDLSTPGEKEALRQIVDRAGFRTRIALDGQTVTEARYMVKSSGSSHFEILLPQEDDLLWSPTVNGRKVIPVQTGSGLRIPLQDEGGRIGFHSVELGIAAGDGDGTSLRITLPQLSVPVLHSRWIMEPAKGQELHYLGGSLAPVRSGERPSGFAQIRRLLSGEDPWPADTPVRLGIGAALLLLSTICLLLCGQEAIRPFRWRHRTGIALGALACILSLSAILPVATEAGSAPPGTESGLDFDFSLTPKAQPPHVLVHNRPLEVEGSDLLIRGWPLIPAVLLLFLSRFRFTGIRRQGTELAAWIVAFLGMLSWPMGGPAALTLALVFLLRHWILPALQQAWRAGPAALVLLSLPLAAGTPERVEQQIEVRAGIATGHATLVWEAKEGELLSLLAPPGILTGVDLDENHLRLVRGAQGAVDLLALSRGKHFIRMDYQLPVTERDSVTGMTLPAPAGLINLVEIDLDLPQADLTVERAVSVDRIEEREDGTSRWSVVPDPEGPVDVRWKPRQRDRSEEVAVYFAELTTLLVPGTGQIENLGFVAIRPTQGEVQRIRLSIPEGLSVNDAWAPHLSRWRFEPEVQRLDIHLEEPQGDPFLVRIHCQWMTGPLPYAARISFPSVEGASGQVAAVAVATDGRIQITSLNPEGMVPIDPQDFPPEALEGTGASLRQAFRYNISDAALEMEVAAVDPHVVVETRERISLGEDRTLHALTLDCRVTRAGIFHLDFALPAEMGIDTVSGSHLSHWTESEREGERILALHLGQRSQGRLRFDLTLSGPGLSQAGAWEVPRILVDQAARQSGHLTLVPEQGIHLRLDAQANVSPVAPGDQGGNLANALAFNLLNRDWSLSFSIEQLAAWVKVDSLQDILFTEGKVRMTQHLDFRIKNSAVRTLILSLPENAENVDFEGDHIADQVRNADALDGQSPWEVRLQRRILGDYRLRATFEMRLPEGEEPFTVRGVEVPDADLQRSYLVLRTRGRLQLDPGEIPDTLYSTDWFNIPASLRRHYPENFQVEHSFRAISPDFQFQLGVSRREIAATQSSRVEDFNLTTLLSQNGGQLTLASIELSPGSKRELRIGLPSGSDFWFARVEKQTVSALEGDEEQLIIPLMQGQGSPDPILVEVLYFREPAPGSGSRRLDAVLRSLSLDLTARKVDWTVILDPVWKTTDWEGQFQLVESAGPRPELALDFDRYVSEENRRLVTRNQEAEGFLERGNQLLQQGDDEQALYNFSNSYIISEQNTAFNEDARVQMQKVKNLKAQAAIAAQQFRQRNDPGGQIAAGPREALSANQILERIRPDNGAELVNLAERLVEQQDEAVQAPRGFEMTFPEQGERLVFLKSVQVDSLDDLELVIRARHTTAAGGAPVPFLLLCGLLGLGVGGRKLAGMRKARTETISD